jgi:predicted nucleic acid-binding protein
VNAVFGDTSALFAVLNAGDANHHRARRAFERLRVLEAPLVSTSYVLVETYALIGRRLGLDALGRFRAEFAPLIDVVWIDQKLHEAGLDLLLERRKRLLSLVDAVSFVVMRRAGIVQAFGFDPHFEQEGFSLVA